MQNSFFCSVEDIYYTNFKTQSNNLKTKSNTSFESLKIHQRSIIKSLRLRNRKVVTSPHTMLKFYLTKITPSNAASRRPLLWNKEMSRDEGMDLPAIYNPLLGRTWVTTLLLRNLTFYIADEVRAIWTKYSILTLNCK